MAAHEIGRPIRSRAGGGSRSARGGRDIVGPTPGSAPAAPAAPADLALVAAARTALDDATAAVDPGERFRYAHLSALRAAAAITAVRGRPGATRRRLESVWVLLDRWAPEHAEWAVYFAAGAPVRAAVEAGVRSAASPRVADDQLRAAGEFLAVAERSLGLLAA